MKHNTLRLNFELFQFSFEFFYFDFHPVYICYITTLNNHAIQGAITSPAISNIIFRSLDIRIEKYCEKIGVHYTRYADDMLFSSESSYIHSYKFTNAIQAIISDKGFYLNRKKTLKCENEISLNGSCF